MLSMRPFFDLKKPRGLEIGIKYIEIVMTCTYGKTRVLGYGHCEHDSENMRAGCSSPGSFESSQLVWKSVMQLRKP